jgi:thioredoxin 1
MRSFSNHAPMRRLLIAGFVLGALGIAPVLASSSLFQPYKKESFETALKAAKPVLVHVHAEWCPTCKKQEQVFNDLAKSGVFAKLTPIRVNFDTDSDFKKSYGVNNQSILLVFKGGKEVARSGGVTDATKLAEFVTEAAK